MGTVRAGFSLRRFAAHLAEHPTLMGRGLNGQLVLLTLAACGQYFRQHPERYSQFTAAVLERGGQQMTQQWGEEARDVRR